MKIRNVLLAIAATSAITGAVSTGAFAANPNDTNHPSNREQMADRCAALENQYDGLFPGKLNALKADKADGLHAQGVNACESNNSDVGAIKLEQALRTLGVKPAA